MSKWELFLLRLTTVLSCFLNFKGGSDTERSQTASKKITFKKTRPEEWLQEKGNHR